MMDLNKKKAQLSAADDFGHDERFSDALLLQFIEGTLTAEQTAEVQAHLNECAVCSHIVGEVYYTKAHPITAEEQREAEKLLTRTPEEEVAKLLNLPDKKVRMVYVSPQPRWYEKLFAPPLAGRLAFAVCAVLLVSGGRGVWRYAQTTYKLEQAASLLQKEYFVFIETARLSGGYGSSGIGELMSPDDEKEESFSARAGKLATDAIQNGAEPVPAKQLLAQSLFIEKKYAQVDSLMRELTPLATTSATLLNDLGVYHFQKRNWAEADKYFSAALARDPSLLESRYNLALAKQELGAREEAVRLMQEYLMLETDENWKVAAAQLIKKMAP